MAEKGESGSFPWASLLVILLSGGGLFYLIPSLNSSRPNPASLGQAADSDPGLSPGLVDARLWQDPLAAIADARKKNGAVPPLSTLTAKLAESAPDNVVVLVVLIPGKHYVEDAENRLRTRFATIQALAGSNLYPCNNAQLGSVLLDRFDKDRIEAELLHPDSLPWPVPGRALGSVEIPYEWFERGFDQAKLPEKALVLWLRDDVLQEIPWTQLAYLFQNFKTKDGTLANIKLLGPANSGSLRDMVEQATHLQGPLLDAVRERLATTRIYSSQAAAEDRILTAGLKLPESTTCGELFRKTFNPGPPSHFSFERVNLPDDKITDALCEELSARRIDPHGGRDHIAIINEIDTYYARALRMTVGTPRSGSGDKWSPLSNIHSFSYLRGLDGELPTDNNADKPNGDPDKNKHPQIEPPEGFHQTDYLRRLSYQLKKLDEDLAGSGGLRGVGVLGSDTYDKLEILAALRPMLPNALFFTNQMDARYIHPDEWSRTRNLIVAASFGLLPESAKLGERAPFRDSYQTGLFLAVDLALKGTPPPSVEPRIYEVGRHGLVDLSPSRTAGNSFAFARFLWEAPPDGSSDNRELLVKKGVGLLVGLILAGFLWRGLRPRKIPEKIEPPSQKAVPPKNPPGKLRARFSKFWTPQHRRIAAAGAALVAAILLPCLIFHFLEGVPLPRFLSFLLGAIALGALLYGVFIAPRQRELASAYPSLAEATTPANGASARPSPSPREKRSWLEFLADPIAAVLLSVLFTMLGVAILMAANGIHGHGEPFSLSEGVSQWPGVGILLFSGFLSIHFCAAAQVGLVRNERAITKEFALPDTKPTEYFWSWGQPRKEKKRLKVEDLWSRYCARGRLTWRIIRASGMTTLYLLAIIFFSRVLVARGPDLPLFRGDDAMLVMFVARSFSITAGAFLTFFVLDSILLHAEFLRFFREHWSLWPKETFIEHGYMANREGKRETVEREKDLSNYWDLLLIGRRTEAINAITYFPFLYLLLFLATLTDYFDNAVVTAPLVFLVATLGVIASSAAYCLPKKARAYREKILALMQTRNRQGLVETGQTSTAMALLIDEVRNLHQGAFAGIWEQPWLRAWILPSSGLGIWALLQYLPK